MDLNDAIAYIGDRGNIHTRACATVHNYQRLRGGCGRGICPNLYEIPLSEALQRLRDGQGHECANCRKMRLPRTCACGRPVADHSKPEQAAMRAYARSTDELWARRYEQAEKAFRDAMPRRKAYSLDEASDAGYHARRYVVKLATSYGAPGPDAVLVRMIDEGYTEKAEVFVLDDTVEVTYWFDGRRSHTDVLAKRPANVTTGSTWHYVALRRQIPALGADGFIPVHDWRK